MVDGDMVQVQNLRSGLMKELKCLQGIKAVLSIQIPPCLASKAIRKMSDKCVRLIFPCLTLVLI